MATAWIKIRITLPDDPKVIGIARQIGTTPEHVCGCLIRVWALADEFALSRICPDDNGTIEGLLSRYCPADIDRKAGQKGMAEALVSCGWLRIYPDGIGFPEWDTHNSSSAKTRACEQKKKKRQRTTPPELSRICPDDNGTKQGTREEKRREDLKENPLTPFPENLNTPNFREAWQRWEKYRKERKKTLTESTRQTQLKKLAAFTEAEAVGMIDRAIEKGWIGLVFPENTKGGSDGHFRRDPTRIESPSGKYSGIEIRRPAEAEDDPDTDLFTDPQAGNSGD